MTTPWCNRHWALKEELLLLLLFVKQVHGYLPVSPLSLGA